MVSKGSPLLQVRVDAVTLQGLRAYAVAEGVNKSELVRRIIAAWVKDRVAVSHPTGGVFDTLNHIGVLIGQMQLCLYPVQIASRLPKRGQGDVQLKRDELYEIALGILREAARLSENEELAAKAKARLSAMKLATQASFAAECILRDYQREDIITLVDRLVETNELLKEELRALKERTTTDTPAT